MDDEKFMRLAIDEAKKAYSDGEKNGIGSIIVKDDEVISFDHNNVKLNNDSTAHAEINAIRNASNKLKTHRLEECVLYITCEPCPMCFAAAWWSRISKIVFGIYISDVVEKGNRQINMSCEELNKKGTYQIDIEGGFLKEECLKFFK